MNRLHQDLYSRHMLSPFKSAAFAFFLLFAISSHGQGGCLWWKSRVFVLELCIPTEWELTREPVITLVNEDSIPYQHEVYLSGRDMDSQGDFGSDGRSQLADITFHKNIPYDPAVPPHQRHSVHRYTNGLPENVYTCWIPEHDKEPFSKLYQARIVIRHQREIDTLYYPLAYSYALDPCTNGLDTDRPDNKLKTMSGEDFEPRVIEVDKPLPPRYARKPWTDVYFKFDTHKISGGAGKDSLLDLYQVRAYDVHSQALLQIIPIDDAMPFHPNLRYQNIETFDLFDDNPKGITDFRYITDIVVDTSRNFSRTRYRQFLYNPEWSKFMTNEVLSGYFDVRKDDTAGGVTRHERVYEGDSLFIYRYRFANDEWHFTRKDATYLGPPRKPMPPPVTPCIIWEDYPMMSDQVVWADSVNVAVIKRDVRIQNRCSDAISRSDMRSAWPQDFDAPKKILAGDTAILALNTLLNTYDGLILMAERNLYITYGDEPPKTLVFQAFVLGKGVTVVKRDGRPHQYISKINDDGFTVNVLEVDELGRPRQFGPARSGTLEKVDRWRMWDETGKEVVSKEYQRKYMVGIQNPERMTERMRVYVLDSGSWHPQELYVSGHSVYFYAREEMDSIRIDTKKARLQISVEDQSYPFYGSYSGCFIEPGDFTIETNQGSTPLDFLPGAFCIRWDEKWYTTNSDEQSILKEIERLKQTYSELSFSRLWEEPRFWVIQFPGSGMNNPLRTFDLLSEPSVGGLGQVLRRQGHRNFVADRGFQIKVKKNASKEEIGEALRRHGFSTEFYGVTDPYYTVTDSTRLLDMDYFQRIKALSEEEVIVAVHQNFLHSFQLDIEMPGMERD